ncbi:phage tail tube protein [Timonella sp. A28]|uniref:phage tail tube protein n=1 Tax=Timonella sp. A28 TaxID=3442640 RepID=UPI003EBEE863
MSVSTEYGFGYEYGLDIFDPVSGQWLPFRFPTGINPQSTPVTSDGATYDDLGAPREVKLSESWTADFQVQQHRLANGSYLPEVEALMALTKPSATGAKAVGRFRWYDKPAAGLPNPQDAYEGDATVTLNRGNTDNSGIGAWSVSLAGLGRRRQIENPWLGWGVADTPFISSITPAGAVTGDLVTITGSDFTGATGVAFGLAAATEFAVISPSSIAAVLPTDAAGTVSVTVVTAAGTSNAVEYARGA